MAELVENTHVYDEAGYLEATDALQSESCAGIDAVWAAGGHLSNIEETLTTALQESDVEQAYSLVVIISRKPG